MSEQPKRRIEITLQIGADSVEDLRAALRQITFEVIDKGSRQCVTGGYSWGGHWSVTERLEMTHDAYFEALEKYGAEAGEGDGNGKITDK